jgi:hypothetical protein
MCVAAFPVCRRADITEASTEVMISEKGREEQWQTTPNIPPVKALFDTVSPYCGMCLSMSKKTATRCCRKYSLGCFAFTGWRRLTLSLWKVIYNSWIQASLRFIIPSTALQTQASAYLRGNDACRVSDGDNQKFLTVRMGRSSVPILDCIGTADMLCLPVETKA